MKDVLRTVPLSPFAPIRSVIAKKMQENEEKNIKIVAGSKKSRTFATAIEKQRLQRKRVPWMSGLVSGLQNRVRRFESARNLNYHFKALESQALSRAYFLRRPFRGTT